jgi:hypothetical protein
VVILVVFLASQLFVKKKVVSTKNYCHILENGNYVKFSLSFFQDQLNFHKLFGFSGQNTNLRSLRTVQCHSSSESAQKPYASDVCDNEGLLLTLR